MSLHIWKDKEYHTYEIDGREADLSVSNKVEILSADFHAGADFGSSGAWSGIGANPDLQTDVDAPGFLYGTERKQSGKSGNCLMAGLKGYCHVHSPVFAGSTVFFFPKKSVEGGNAVKA